MINFITIPWHNNVDFLLEYKSYRIKVAINRLKIKFF